MHNQGLFTRPAVFQEDALTQSSSHRNCQILTLARFFVYTEPLDRCYFNEIINVIHVSGFNVLADTLFMVSVTMSKNHH